MAQGLGKKLDWLRAQGPYRVITQLVLYGLDEETKRLKLIVLHPRVSLEEVKKDGNFEIIIPDKVGTSYVPTEEDLRILRQEIDPAGMVLGK